MVDVVSAYAVHSFSALVGDYADEAWNLFSVAFASMRTAAMQRHMMTRPEFDTVMADTRVTKYLATDGTGMLGMSTLTNDLDAVPLIEPAWFEHRFPAPYTARQIWYLGFACVRDPATLTGGKVFSALIDHMAIPARLTRGMVFMDFATANAARLVPGIRRTVARLDPEHTFERYDSQEFWGFDFREGATA